MTWLVLLLTIAVQAPAAPTGQTSQPPAASRPPAPSPSPAAPAPQMEPPVLPVTVVARLPHDPQAFTEGLIWHDGALYESTGREGESEVRRVEPATGRITARARIPAAQFGEGLARVGDDLISLTWHDGIAHRWRARDLKPLGTLRYAGEGWGLAGDARDLWQSDGSAVLIRRDPKTLAERGRLPVTLRGRPLREVNELEMVDGQILANVWHTPFLVRIDPASGRVTAIVDLRPLVAEIGATDPEAVANGIAWDPKGKRLFVTGKLWPTTFEIRIGS